LTHDDRIKFAQKKMCPEWQINTMQDIEVICLSVKMSKHWYIVSRAKSCN